MDWQHRHCLGENQIMLVRPLRPDDMNGVMTLMEYYRDQMQIDEMDWDEDAVVQSIKFFSTNMQCTTLVAVEGYRIIGLLVGNVKKEFYNNKYTAAIQLFFLMPGFKHNEYYAQMYSEFVVWSKLVKAEKILMLDMSDNTDTLADVKELLEFDTKMFKLFIKDGA